MAMQLRADVDDQTIKRNIDINLQRLKRQYDISVKQYDEASLMDLSHLLRMWVDMQDNVQRYLDQASLDFRFKKYTLRPELLKQCHGSKCIIAYFADGGVITYTKGSTWSVSTSSLSDGPSKINLSWRPLVGGGLQARHLVIIAGSRVDQDFDIYESFIEQETTFKDWLKSESVRIWFTNKVGRADEKIITREMLIKRVANALGGSHPAGVFDVPNKYDEAVEFLLNYKVGEIPLPYYVLVKTAHDILTCFNYLNQS